MGMFETLKKYKWMLPLITKADRKTKAVLLKNAMNKNKNFSPKEDVKANVKDLINCMLCPNMCRFDCGTLQASQKESMSPAYKARIGYYLTMGKIDPTDPANKDFVDLMYLCSNEESCKAWCPFEFSVVSLLETVRDDLMDKGVMPDVLKPKLNNLKTNNTIEDDDIFKTYKKRGINNIETAGNDDVYYYIGCESMKFPEVINTNIKLLQQAGVKVSTNLDKKTCCGSPAFNIRDIETGKMLAEKNKDLIASTGAKLIVSDCPGCVLSLTKKYQDNGIKIKPKVIHIVQYIKQLIDEGKLKFEKTIPDEFKRVTIHDPCLIARNLGDITSIRAILNTIPGLEIVEPICNKESTHCCGWSGIAHWIDKDLATKEASNRIEELKETGANIIISACPLCELGLGYGVSTEDKEKIQILDIAELLLKVI